MFLANTKLPPLFGVSAKTDPVILTHITDKHTNKRFDKVTLSSLLIWFYFFVSESALSFKMCELVKTEIKITINTENQWFFADFSQLK
tara:strand:- start:1362 stop:1625 length:264 start_codon:yes stop_codon:yes gene_type:complete